MKQLIALLPFLPLLVAAGEQGPSPPTPALPPAPSVDPYLGPWKADFVADYSTCDDVKPGDTRAARWNIAAGKKAGTVTLTDKSAKKGEPSSFSGGFDTHLQLDVRSGKQAGLVLWQTDAGLAGRALTVRKSTCAVTWTLTATRPNDEPIDVGAADPDAGSWTLAKALAGLPDTGTLTADIDTAQGTITCELFPDKAPQTVANFVGLARGLRAWKDPVTGHFWRYRAYYDGLLFHRVIPEFIIQGGDPQSRDPKSTAALGTGGPGYSIPDEFKNGLRFDQPGRLAMAHKGPGTGGSQFFITEVAAPSLDGSYTIFGQCAAPDVVKTIARVPADATTGRPKTPVTMAVRIYKK